jgi:acetyltransferase-like isoleucine patch superfamily enzyme
LRRDHRPYFIKRLYLRWQKLYASHFLKPQFESLGCNPFFIKPWHVELFGGPIQLGDYATVIATSDHKIRFTVWPNQPDCKGIRIGNYCLISPGVRISAAAEIIIKDNCMLASQVYLTDADWHGVYDRASTGSTKPILLHENVWVGDSAIVCKGVTIGKNSIIGAGSVVVSDIPANVIAAGNPAQVVKELDPNRAITPRSSWFEDPLKLNQQLKAWDQALLTHNTIGSWIKHLIKPQRGD